MGANTQIKPDKEQAIIFFDGVCNLCNGAVQFIIKRDHHTYFKFAPLQSSKALEVLPHHGVNTSELESILLLENGRLIKKSSAALTICKGLSGVWPLLYILKIVPSPIRDFFYDWIAKNRYQWFGKKDECMVPTPEINARFIEAG